MDEMTRPQDDWVGGDEDSVTFKLGKNQTIFYKKDTRHCRVPFKAEFNLKRMSDLLDITEAALGMFVFRKTVGTFEDKQIDFHEVRHPSIVGYSIGGMVNIIVRTSEGKVHEAFLSKLKLEPYTLSEGDAMGTVSGHLTFYSLTAESMISRALEEDQLLEVDFEIAGRTDDMFSDEEEAEEQQGSVIPQLEEQLPDQAE